MMKRILTLFVFFVVLSQMVVWAGVPFIPSTDTEDGAHWYRIRQIRLATWEEPAYIKAGNIGENVGYGEFDEDSDELLWCFVGSEADGFQIYNKAFLFNDTRLIAVDEGWGVIQLQEASTAWNYSWEIVSEDVDGTTLWGISTDGVGSRVGNILHGAVNNPVIFYGASPDLDGYACAWVFEDASLPVIPSLPILPPTERDGKEIDTSKHLEWYRVKNVRHSLGTAPPYMKAVDLGVHIGTEFHENSNNVLWCFIGTASEGYQIHNRAFLNKETRVIGVDLDGALGYIELADAATEWNDSWKFAEAGDAYGLTTTSGYGRGGQFLHGWSGENHSIIFYGGADDDGCAWAFEAAGTEIPVDFSVLEALITACTEQVATDKLDAYNMEFYGEGIAIFEEAIASAQDVVDNPDAAQADVNEAVLTLKKARASYALAYIDLPFELSKDGTWNWYRIKNERRDREADAGYWTNNSGAISAIAENESDNQLWAFTGNNFTGVNIYNKADMADGAKLVNIGGFGISNLPWDGAWKIDRTINDGAYWYGIVNVNGRYNDGASAFEDFIHTYQDGSGLVYYGFGDSGSWYDFEFVTSTGSSINNLSKDDIVVFAKDGMIYVKGTESKTKIYSLTGKLVDVFDAQNPYTVANKGIYIVQVDGKAYKVVVL